MTAAKHDKVAVVAARLPAKYKGGERHGAPVRRRKEPKRHVMGAALEGHDVGVDGARLDPAREMHKVLPMGRARRATATKAGVGTVPVTPVQRRAPGAARVVDLGRKARDVRVRRSRVLRLPLKATAEWTRRRRIILHPPRNAAAAARADPVPPLELPAVAAGGRCPSQAAMGDPNSVEGPFLAAERRYGAPVTAGSP